MREDSWGQSGHTIGGNTARKISRPLTQTQIIEEPSNEEDEDLFEEYVIKGAAFTLGMLIIIGMTAALISDTLLTVLSSSLLSLGILVAVFALTEEE